MMPDCPSTRLNGNPPYQRELVFEDWSEVATNYDSDLFGAIVIAIEQDLTYEDWLASPINANIVDGRQRWHGGTQVEEGPLLQTVPVHFYAGKSITRQAEMFGGYDHRRSLQPWDKIRYRVVTKDPVAIDIQKIVGETGFRLYDTKRVPGEQAIPQRSPKTIKAIANVEKAYKVDSGVSLLASLRNHAQGFPETQVRGDYLVAHARVLSRYDIKPTADALRDTSWSSLANFVSEHPSRRNGKNQGGGSLFA